MKDLPDLFRRLRPIMGTAVDALWIEYQTADMDGRREIEGLLNLLAMKHLGMGVAEDKLLLDPPPPSISDGAYELGQVSYPGILPYPVRLRPGELLRHVFILGPTGTGKSTLLLTLLLQVLQDTPALIFDFKRNYRPLLLARDDVVVLTVGRDTAPLHTNVLQPPRGVSFDEMTNALCDIVSDSYLLMQGARNVLKEALIAAHDRYKDAATLRHARDLVHAELGNTKSGSRRYGWLESTARSLDELSTGPLGAALCTNGITVEDVLRERIVFELHGLGEDQKRFFCLYWLQAVMLARKNSSGAREVLQHVLVFDEGHNVFPKERDLGIGSRLAREIREYGEAIITATQQSDINESIIANSGIKIILRCDFPRDILFASQLLQLRQEWLPRLRIGEAIIRLPSRFLTPFLITYPEQPLKNKYVSDEEVAARYSRLLGTPTEPDLAAQEDALLRDVVTHPISPITERYQRLGLNPTSGNILKDRIIAAGLATFLSINTGTATTKILTLTTAGHALLGTTPSANRLGGVEHQYWAWRMTKHLERFGYQVTTEHAVGSGQTVDLCATKADRSLLIEIETGASDITRSLEKLRDGGVLFCTTDALLERLHEHTPPNVILHSPRSLGTWKP